MKEKHSVPRENENILNLSLRKGHFSPLLPQGLCVCCSFSLEYFLPAFLQDSCYMSFMFKWSLIREPFPTNPTSQNPLTSPTLSYNSSST